MSARRILIVGGVAGGASAAARLRRMCESCEVVLYDRGPFVAFANCGLPYFVGDVIGEEGKLLVATPEALRERLGIEARTEHEVLSIDRQAKEIVVRDLKTDRTFRDRYDALLLSPGAAPIRPPLPGIDLPGIFALRTIPDSRKIREAVAARGAHRAAIIGAGFIGLEMAENLHRREMAVTVIEAMPQVLPPLDPEMAHPIAEGLRAAGVDLRLGDAVAGFEAVGTGLVVRTASGARIEADLAILAIGVKPETTLARAAGIDLGPRGGIAVDGEMRTNDPAIWAVGDVIEVRHIVTGDVGPLPLAGPANREGRIAAESIARSLALGGAAATRPIRTFRGVQGTAVCEAFGIVAATTGASERSLRRAGREDFEAIYLHPGHHAAYYPGAKPIHMKLLFERGTGRVLGAQAVGESGIEKRIDVIATAIQLGGTVYDLEEAELSYAPQFGAAKDPVNVAGMIAANHLRGDLPLGRWRDLAAARIQGAVLLDVRDAAEFAAGHVDGAMNFPLATLRARLDELPRDREIWIYCGVGQRSYYATRTLIQRGFRVRDLPGGWATYQALRESGGLDLP